MIYSDLAEEQCRHCGQKLVPVDITRAGTRVARGQPFAGEPCELVAVHCANCGKVTVIVYRVGFLTEAERAREIAK